MVPHRPGTKSDAVGHAPAIVNSSAASKAMRSHGKRDPEHVAAGYSDREFCGRSRLVLSVHLRPGLGIYPAHAKGLERLLRNKALLEGESARYTFCTLPYVVFLVGVPLHMHLIARDLTAEATGKGGFAKCYKVIDVDTKLEWACKVVQKASLTKQRHKVKLQTEIKIHKSLNHKHVVRFEDVFEDKEHVYIIMELCTNQTLLECVKRKRRLTESETRRYMLQMLDGVGFLHRSKVIHRDLKLGNLFLDRGDDIKIGDFGLACKVQFDGERKRTLCGTPNYIAPEVLEGKNGHSYEVDLWSIGVVMYTCLVGKPPFETNDVKSTYNLIKTNSYSFPERLCISDGAKSLVRRILQSDPEARPDIEQVLIDPWLLGEGTALLHKVSLSYPPALPQFFHDGRVLQGPSESGISSSALSCGSAAQPCSSLSCAVGILVDVRRWVSQR